MALLFSSNANAIAGYTKIQNDIFDNAHLKNISEAGILHYKYKKEHFSTGEREDTIDVVLTNLRNTGRKDTHIEFFTGAHNRPYLDRENQQGNSVVVFFLEYDVREMGKRHMAKNGRSRWHYFQNKIKSEMAKQIKVEKLEIEYKGEKVQAVKYIIQPFVNDPNRADFHFDANKYYIFTLSESIPGGIYQVRTVVPDGKTWQEGEATLADESVIFDSFEPTL
ncbi:MAG: hypothetical protein COA90_04615 [Gammaproteobacteria bacterium]|nr:MAG: hypothetical protein COA90_04615 [Gammaproteobacteria bacterium]